MWDYARPAEAFVASQMIRPDLIVFSRSMVTFFVCIPGTNNTFFTTPDFQSCGTRGIGLVSPEGGSGKSDVVPMLFGMHVGNHVVAAFIRLTCVVRQTRGLN